MNIPYKFYLALPKKLDKEILNFLQTSYKKYIYYDTYHMNYDENKLRKTWHIIFVCRGSLRHLIYFDVYTRVKRLNNIDSDLSKAFDIVCPMPCYGLR